MKRKKYKKHTKQIKKTQLKPITKKNNTLKYLVISFAYISCLIILKKFTDDNFVYGVKVFMFTVFVMIATIIGLAIYAMIKHPIKKRSKNKNNSKVSGIDTDKYYNPTNPSYRIIHRDRFK